MGRATEGDSALTLAAPHLHTKFQAIFARQETRSGGKGTGRVGSERDQGGGSPAPGPPQGVTPTRATWATLPRARPGLQELV